ncbi:hypothetical protein LXEBMM8_EKPBGFGD_02828 [Lactiplantibacillus xiangfangensis]
MSINVASVIVPGFGTVADAGLSGINCLLDHVSTIVIGKYLFRNMNLLVT